jgi:arginine-tRNA-protein transferase
MNYLDADQPSRQIDGSCKLVVVQDQLQDCPYRSNTTARMPLRLPVGTVTPEITDELLAMGYRRSGDFVYRTQCPTCDECKPTRVPVDTFRLTSSMKRVRKRGDRELTCYWGTPQVDQQRIAMFNQHRVERRLGNGEQVDANSYSAFLNDTCCETLELAVYHERQLVAVSVIDVGLVSISAVYTHFDPHYSRFSLGTYAILKQMQWAMDNDRSLVYLGMYVADNPHLNYKARFGPQQRLTDGLWQDIA